MTDHEHLRFIALALESGIPCEFKHREGSGCWVSMTGLDWELAPGGDDHRRYQFRIQPGRAVDAAKAWECVMNAQSVTAKAPAERQTQYIVVRRNAQGEYRPAIEPFVHATAPDAEVEAARLAEKQPGDTFVVFAARSAYRAPTPKAERVEITD